MCLSATRVITHILALETSWSACSVELLGTDVKSHPTELDVQVPDLQEPGIRYSGGGVPAVGGRLLLEPVRGELTHP